MEKRSLGRELRNSSHAIILRDV